MGRLTLKKSVTTIPKSDQRSNSLFDEDPTSENKPARLTLIESLQQDVLNKILKKANDGVGLPSKTQSPEQVKSILKKVNSSPPTKRDLLHTIADDFDEDKKSRNKNSSFNTSKGMDDFNDEIISERNPSILGGPS